MIKRKSFLKQVLIGATAIMMAFSSIVAYAAPASGNPAHGTNGHSEFAWYITPTAVRDVYEVQMDMNVYVKPEKAEIVLVLDNSGSMGYPYDLSYGVWEGANQDALNPAKNGGYKIPKTAYTATAMGGGQVQIAPNLPPTDSSIHLEDPYVAEANNPGSTALSGMSPLPAHVPNKYLIPTHFAGAVLFSFPGPPQGVDGIPVGAFNGGVEAHAYEKLVMYDPPISTDEYQIKPYRLEWVRRATSDILDQLLSEEKNPLNYDQIKIKIITFGSAGTDVTTTGNPLTWPSGALDYNGAPTTGWTGVMGGGSLYFSSSGAQAQSKDGIAYQSAWIDNTNLEEEKEKFENGYVRRAEGTYVVAGLEGAMTAFKDLKADLGEEWAPENRHVFVLADGGDNSTADINPAAAASVEGKIWNAGGSSPTILTDPTRSLAAAAVLKNPTGDYNAKFTTVGVLDQSKEHNSAQVGQLSYLSVPATSVAGDGSFAERHLLLLAAPILPSADQFKAPAASSSGGYYGNFITQTGGSSDLIATDQFNNHMNYQTAASATTFASYGDGYGAFANDIASHLPADYNAKTSNYHFAADSKEVQKAFTEFAAKFTESASDIHIKQRLTQLFDVYQMPGEDLYRVSDGTVTISGKDIDWDINAINAKGGTATLKFYVKFDSAKADPNLSYQVAEFTSVVWKSLGGVTASSTFPSAFISGDTSDKGWKVDNSGMNTVNGKGSTISATGNVLTDSPGSINAANISSGSVSQGTGGSVAFLGAGPQPYTASVANTAATKKKKQASASTTANKVETLSDSEYKAVKGKKLKVKNSKAAVYSEPSGEAQANLYLTKGKTFKIAGATKNYYMIQYKKKDGKLQKGYLLKTDVNVEK